MATIYIDSHPYDVDSTENLLHQCLSLGFDVPYFCWHPALGSVGACRQCAVKQFKDESDEDGKIVMACMTPAADGTRISIDDPDAVDFRARVVEWLMQNHPHDCPICDEGGECHLQDMTVMTGHTYRRFRFPKRTFNNQDLGPFINHEMNRCITCYRCVRFYGDYAGGQDLRAFASKNHVYFGREGNGTLENEFSGNLVEICPTGVFTDKTLKRHYTRKWDLQSAPSVCPHCGLGCNVLAGERYGSLRRILNRYHHEVNGYFLCDRGRFGYEYVNGERRIHWAYGRKGANAELQPLRKPEAMRLAADILGDAHGVVGIGSPRASVEANFALRALVGTENFHLGFAEHEAELMARIVEIAGRTSARWASLREVEEADAVLILGEDVTNTAPRLSLALRQSVRQKVWEIADRAQIPRWQDDGVRDAAGSAKSPLFIASTGATRLDDVAQRTYRAAPDEIARLGFAVAHAVDGHAPSVADLDGAVDAIAAEIADALQSAERPLVISGTGSGSEVVIQAASNVVEALVARGRGVRAVFAVPECNSMGLAMLGGAGIEEALEKVGSGEADTAVILENDLFRRLDSASAQRLFDAARHVLVLDGFAHDTASKAELVLPAAVTAEQTGSYVSNEGRVQRFFEVFTPEGDTQASWRWIAEIAQASGRQEGRPWEDVDDVIDACANSVSALRGIENAAPATAFRVKGLRIPREPHRYSGRTAMHANVSVHEHKPPVDRDSPLAYSMEGLRGEPPASLIPYYWAPGWNSVQAASKFQQEVGAELRGGDPGVRLYGESEKHPAGRAGHYFQEVPPVFKRHRDQVLVVPFYHIFGSEELSAMAPAIAERSEKSYLAMSPADMSDRGLEASAEVDLRVEGLTYRLPIRPVDTMPAGLAAIPAGLPGIQGIRLPAWGKISGGGSK